MESFNFNNIIGNNSILLWGYSTNKRRNLISIKFVMFYYWVLCPILNESSHSEIRKQTKGIMNYGKPIFKGSNNICVEVMKKTCV